jgi:hypothetical protein
MYLKDYLKEMFTNLAEMTLESDQIMLSYNEKKK